MCDFTGIFIYHIKAVQLLHKWLHSIIPASACQVQVRLDPPHAHGLRSDSTLQPHNQWISAISHNPPKETNIASICLPVYENQ